MTLSKAIWRTSRKLQGWYIVLGCFILFVLTLESLPLLLFKPFLHHLFSQIKLHHFFLIFVFFFYISDKKSELSKFRLLLILKVSCFYFKMLRIFILSNSFALFELGISYLFYKLSFLSILEFMTSFCSAFSYYVLMIYFDLLEILWDFLRGLIAMGSVAF